MLNIFAGASVMFLVVFLVILVVVVYIFFKVISSIFNSFSRMSFYKSVFSRIITDDDYITKEELSDSYYKRIGVTNKIEFINKLKGMFVVYENAYNTLDYATLKNITTSRYYKNLFKGLNINMNAGKKKVINNIKVNNIKITDIFALDDRHIVEAFISVSYISYTVDVNGNIVSGSNGDRQKELFKVSFVKDLYNSSKCPNCGANVSGDVCEYCHTSFKETDFKIDSFNKVTKKAIEN